MGAGGVTCGHFGQRPSSAKYWLMPRREFAPRSLHWQVHTGTKPVCTAGLSTYRYCMVSDRGD